MRVDDLGRSSGESTASPASIPAARELYTLSLLVFSVVLVVSTNRTSSHASAGACGESDPLAPALVPNGPAATTGGA
jgi:hypothetical protein